MKHATIFAAFLTTFVVVAPAFAASRSIQGAAAFAPIAKCRALADDAARLACYDREVSVFDKAVADKRVAVVERAEVTAAKRTLFGIPLPQIKLFAGGDGDDEVKQVETSVTSVDYAADGNMVFGTPDMGTWEQTDTYPLPSIKSGRKVTLKRGMMGSFFAAFEKGPSVRVKRLR